MLSASGQFNRSKSAVVVGAIPSPAPALVNIPDVSATPGLLAGTEAFRFQPGLVTQFDSGSGFNFGLTDRWFSVGRLTVGGGTTARSLYGFRLQKGGQGLTMGYGTPNATPNAVSNPFIEWIGNDNTGVGVGSGNLEFLTAANPGGPPPAGPGIRRLAFTLRSNLTALFGESPSLVIYQKLKLILMLKHHCL